MDTSSHRVCTWLSTPTCAWTSHLSEGSTRLGLFHTDTNMPDLWLKTHHIFAYFIKRLWHTPTNKHNYNWIRHSTGVTSLLLEIICFWYEPVWIGMLSFDESCFWIEWSRETNTRIPERWDSKLVLGCLRGYWATNKPNPAFWCANRTWTLMRLRWIVIATVRLVRLSAQFRNRATSKSLKINRLHRPKVKTVALSKQRHCLICH